MENCFYCNKEFKDIWSNFCSSECKRQHKLKVARDWKKRNPEKNKAITDKWKAEHKEHTSTYNSTYNREHRTEIQPRQTIQHRERKKTDFNFKLATEYRIHLAKFIKGKNKTNKLIGCSLDFFHKWLLYLESELNIKNYGKNGWNIDHIIPCSFFNLENDDELKQCFHWTNLQPLSAMDNFKKGTKITSEEIDIFEQKLNTFIDENDINIPKFDRYKFFN